MLSGPASDTGDKTPMKNFAPPTDGETLSRRGFLQFAVATAVPLFLRWETLGGEKADLLPMGSAPQPLKSAWFPSRMHAFIWRNWGLVGEDQLAAVLGAKPKDVVRIGRSMGLETPRGLSDNQRRRAALTIIRRNWHLLPYEQLLELLRWSPDQMAYTLREDDFFFEKLGRLKPKAAPLRWAEPDQAQNDRAAQIAQVVRDAFPGGYLEGKDPLFSFVATLSKAPSAKRDRREEKPGSLRLGYSYFALYGDPLLDPALDPYPDGYLARLAEVGVNAVWLQGVLGRLSPLPWAPEGQIERRRKELRKLVSRADRHGIKVFLYLNEPRSLPANSPTFETHPEWRGAGELGYNAVCTSGPQVRAALRDAVAGLCRSVPGLGGFFTITASENLTNCWSHGQGGECPRCKARSPAEVIAEVVGVFQAGIQSASGKQRLLAWDWGWADGWALETIERLPSGVALMSVSEWSLPIDRGGVKSSIGEYCLSAIGPGPRATRHWAAAKKRGLPVAAKLQLGVSWEIAAVPYLPALENVTRHVSGLREAGVDDLMLGWTLGGHPSPNLEAVAEIARGGTLETLARKRHGAAHAAAVVSFWQECSAAFREFPFHVGTVYNAPLQMGPANPLWRSPTDYKAAMVGIPYDDLESWCSVYPPEVFASQLEKVAAGFETALAKIRTEIPKPPPSLAEELTFADAASIHFASVANQSRFVLARRAGNLELERRYANAEARLALRLHALQSSDCRLGFEASNQYFYTPLDLVEKVINCRWVAAQL
jgi:hypothetical protein